MPNPPIAAQNTQGPIDRVPCPWCKKGNDFRNVDDLLVDTNESLGVDDPGGQPSFNCDHCGQKMRVVSVRRTTVVILRQEV